MNTGYSINTLDYVNESIWFAKVHRVNLNLENPTTIQDKLFWLNLYEPDIRKTRCADKLYIRDYCKEKIGIDLCIPILKVYDSVDDINLDDLPEQFVIKCTHGSSMNIVVKNKSTFNFEEAKEKLKKWMSIDYAFNNHYEFHYHDIPHKIIVEEYKEDFTTHELRDYKFSCFNGVPKIMCVITNLFKPNETTNYYDMDFKPLGISLIYHPANYNLNIEKPAGFEKMIEYATKLSQDFKYVRVDFFSINGEVYLSELTFTPHAIVWLKFTDKKYDIELGNMLDIS